MNTESSKVQIMSDKAEEPKAESNSAEAPAQTLEPETTTATTEPESKIEENSQDRISDEQSEGKKRPIEEVDQESESENDTSESNITEAKRSKTGEAKEPEETQPEDTQPEDKQNSKKDTSKDETTKEGSKEDSTQEDKKITDNDKAEETKEPEKPKFVFGSGAFGKSSGFSMFGVPKNVFADKSATEIAEKNKESAESSNSPAPKSIFGGGSSFGNAFQKSMNKKSIFDTLPSKSESESQDEDKEKSKEVYKTVHLEKQDIKSGEEEESTQFQVKAKLYHLDLTKVSDGWREKGVGILKVNKFLKPKGHYNGRLVMRQDGILKLILNVPIIKGFEVFKGMVSSMNSDKFIRFQVVEDDKPAQYALKIGQIENSAKLFDEITKLIPKDS